MGNLETIILPYLFMVMFGFIILNLIMNVCLYSFTKIKNIKTLSWYWGSLLLTFVFQGFFQEEQLPIVLSYGSNVIPAVIMSMLLFEIMEKEVPLLHFFLIWLVALVVTPFLHYSGFSFSVVAMPLSLALALVPFITGHQLLFHQKPKTTSQQKFMGALLFIAGVHFINFALFRMGAGNQLWGWALALGLYQLFSVLSFALVLENQSLKENETLQELVAARTSDLSNALKTKETLFRMVLHDIATPIQGQMLIISRMEKAKIEDRKDLLPKLSELTYIVRRVIEQVRSIEAKNSGQLQINLSPVNFERCLREIKTVFEIQMKEKNIELNVVNELDEGTMFYADQTVFTTSVLGNLISNAIKFSPSNSNLMIHAYEKNNKVMIEVVDFGVGMSEEIAFTIFDPTKKHSRPGTNGERGTGFGMAQVKSYIEHFGGEIDVQSWPMESFPQNHGTRIKLTLDKTSGHVH